MIYIVPILGIGLSTLKPGIFLCFLVCLVTGWLILVNSIPRIPTVLSL